MLGNLFGRKKPVAPLWQRTPLSPVQVEAYTARLPQSLTVLRNALVAKSESGVWIEGGDGGAILAGHRPDIAPEAFDLVLFQPLPNAALETYQRMHGFQLPVGLLDLLAHLNGFQLFETTVYGLPPSMVANPPLLNRSCRDPLDIASGRYWRSGYAPTDPAAVLFASQNVSDTGQVGYFMTADGGVVGRGNGGPAAPDDSGVWPSFEEWLASRAV